jgi:hypothetical protein
LSAHGETSERDRFQLLCSLVDLAHTKRWKRVRRRHQASDPQPDFWTNFYIQRGVDCVDVSVHFFLFIHLLCMQVEDAPTLCIFVFPLFTYFPTEISSLSSFS